MNLPPRTGSGNEYGLTPEEMALMTHRNRVEVVLWPLWRCLTWRMDRVRADVVWSSVWSRQIRIALTILFMPHGYSLSATKENRA